MRLVACLLCFILVLISRAITPSPPLPFSECAKELDLLPR